MQTYSNGSTAGPTDTVGVSRRTLLKTTGLSTVGVTTSLSGLVSATPDGVPDGLPRIWPVETNASGGTCTDAGGTAHSATGPGSARWFDYGGCGSWKVFPVVGGEPYYIRANTDRSLLTDMSYHIEERSDGEWVTREKNVYGNRRNAVEVDSYTPSADATEIRIRRVNGGRGDGFYVSVYGPEQATDPTPAFDDAIEDKLALAERVDENALGLLEDRALVAPVLDRLVETSDDRPIEETDEAIRRMTLAETVTDTVLAGAGPGESPFLDGDHDLSAATAEYALNPLVDLVFVNLSIVRIAKRFRTVRRAMTRASRAIGNLIADVLAPFSPSLSRFVQDRATELGEVILDLVLEETESKGKRLTAEELERIRSEETILFVEEGSDRIFVNALSDPDRDLGETETEPLPDSLAAFVAAFDPDLDGPTVEGTADGATDAAEQRRTSINEAIEAIADALESDVVSDTLRTSGLLAASLGSLALVAGVVTANPAVTVIGFASTLLGLAPTVLVSAMAWGTGFVGIVGLRHAHQLALDEIRRGTPMEGV